MGTGKKQFLLAGGAVVLFVLLFIAPKTAPAGSRKEEAGASTASSNATVEVYLGMAAKGLAPDEKSRYDALVASGNNDSLAAYWDRLRRPDLASWFIEREARNGRDAQKWFTAGNRYFYAVRFTKDDSEVPVLYQSAMRCFGKGLEIEPANTDGRIMLASCYVEGGADPMKGIGMLREIERTDSNNVKLQLNFAFFSVKSGQFDKAISRFEKVLRIDSTYLEAYLHLADAYEQKQDKGNTILMLERYAARSNDPMARNEVRKYIEQLRAQQ